MITTLQGNCLEVLKTLPDSSVHCCVSSPPYWGLRSYLPDGHENKHLEIGSEKTPDEYVEKMVSVFHEVRRILRPDGICWLNLGDSYAGSWGNSGNRPELDGDTSNQRPKNCDYIKRGGWDDRRERPPSSYKLPGLKNKDLVGIPWRVAFALQADGWWLRDAIVWAKGVSFCPSYSGNVMPESIADRCTKSYEMVFMLAKSDRYYADMVAVREKAATGAWDAMPPIGGKKQAGAKVNPTYSGNTPPSAGFRNIRNVWTINPEQNDFAHFAIMPTRLVDICIKIGTSQKGCCPECGAPWKRVIEESRKEGRGKLGCGNKNKDGVTRTTAGLNIPIEYKQKKVKTVGWEPTCKCVEEIDKGAMDQYDKWVMAYEPPQPIPCTVLDPFGGSGTTGEVAEKNGQNAILVELNEEYVKIIKKRTAQKSMF